MPPPKLHRTSQHVHSQRQPQNRRSSRKNSCYRCGIRCSRRSFSSCCPCPGSFLFTYSCSPHPHPCSPYAHSCPCPTPARRPKDIVRQCKSRTSSGGRSISRASLLVVTTVGVIGGSTVFGSVLVVIAGNVLNRTLSLLCRKPILKRRGHELYRARRRRVGKRLLQKISTSIEDVKSTVDSVPSATAPSLVISCSSFRCYDSIRSSGVFYDFLGYGFACSNSVSRDLMSCWGFHKGVHGTIVLGTSASVPPADEVNPIASIFNIKPRVAAIRTLRIIANHVFIKTPQQHRYASNRRNKNKESWPMIQGLGESLLDPTSTMMAEYSRPGSTSNT